MKYAERGLVKNGVVDPLFSQLYTVLTGFGSLFLSSLLLASNLSKKQSLSLTICFQQNVSSESLQSLIIGRALSFGGAIVIGILYSSTYYYVNARSRGGRPPKIYGLYKRNLLSFRQTVYFSFITTVMGTVGKTIIFVSINYCHLQKHQLKNVQLMIHFVISLRTLILVIFLHYRVSKFKLTVKKPSKIFYIRSPQIIPRREIQNYNDPPFSIRHQPIRGIPINFYSNSESNVKIISYKKSKVIFVKPLKNVNT